MADCSQLQALLSEVQQDRAALDDPDTYCLDQCDAGDILCIRACHQRIPQLIAADDAAIGRIQDEIRICGILLTTWNFTFIGLGSEQTATLTISSLDGSTTPITDTGFGFTGTFDQSIPFPDIVGSWDEEHQQLTFTQARGQYYGTFDGSSLVGEVFVGGHKIGSWQAVPATS